MHSFVCSILFVNIISDISISWYKWVMWVWYRVGIYGLVIGL